MNAAIWRRDTLAAGTVRAVREAAGDVGLVELADRVLDGLRLAADVGEGRSRRCGQLVDAVPDLQAVGLGGRPREEERHLATGHRRVGLVRGGCHAGRDLGGDQADDLAEAGIGRLDVGERLGLGNVLAEVAGPDGRRPLSVRRGRAREAEDRRHGEGQGTCEHPSEHALGAHRCGCSSSSSWKFVGFERCHRTADRGRAKTRAEARACSWTS